MLTRFKFFRLGPRALGVIHRCNARVYKLRNRILEFTSRLCRALDEPMHYGEQNADRQPAHEHAHNTFHRTQSPPHLRQDNIAIANGRITGCREVKGRFPKGETNPAIKCRPEQNLHEVQGENGRCEMHHEDRGLGQLELVAVPP